MCLSIPLKIVKISGKRAIVRSAGHVHKVDLSLLKNVKVGDYVLVHGDLALNKVNKSEASRILKLVKNFSYAKQ